MDDETRMKLESAAFRGLVKHLQNRNDVQNIDIMILAGFCRNCLSKWLLSAAKEIGVKMSKDEALEQIYGMTYSKWKERYQTAASEKQLMLFEETKPLHAEISGHN